MSSIAPTASVSSQPPITVPPPAKDDPQTARISERKDAKAAERTAAKDDVQVGKAAEKDEAKAAEKAAKVDDLAATAVKAQAAKSAGTGAVLDIQA